MTHSGEHSARRRDNAEALAAFGVAVEDSNPDTVYRTIRSGEGASIFTIGYEGRSGDDLVAQLRDAGVDTLVDVRERPFSRKPDFRRKALEQLCVDAGIDYESWTRVGSTGHQRVTLKATGDIREFMRRFRDFVKRGRDEELDALAKRAEKGTIALLCYERSHDECHRCIVADLLADRMDATIVAIL